MIKVAIYKNKKSLEPIVILEEGKIKSQIYDQAVSFDGETKDSNYNMKLLNDCETSLSPIFVAAGSGIKKGFKTERIIRQVDVVATVAAMMNVRMPAQCEGASVYQILDREF